MNQTKLKMLKINLQLFGVFRSLSKEAMLQIMVPDASSVKIFKQVVSEFLASNYKDMNVMKLIPYCAFARQDEILDEDSMLCDNDTIAILPPVSGG